MPTTDLLVVGGSGLLGGELARRGRSDGRSVVATYHRSGRGSPDVEWAALDLGDTEAIGPLIEDVRPRAIVNAAYVQSGDDLQEVTASAPGHLAAAAVGIGARFVHVSTDLVFPGDSARAHLESDPVAPISDYGRAKVQAEQIVAGTDATAVIVRTSLLWGGTEWGAQEQMVADPMATFFTNQVRCPLRVDRLAAAIVELTDRPEITGLLHVAGTDAVDRLTFARHLAPRVGADPAELRGAVDDSRTRANHIVLDSSLARELLANPLPGVLADAP